MTSLDLARLAVGLSRSVPDATRAESSDARTGATLYPSQWERHLVLSANWQIFVRPIQLDDEALLHDFLQTIDKQDLRFRFFDSIKEFTHPFLATLTQLDYAHAMAFVAFDETQTDMLGVVRVHSDPIGETGEYAILLRSDLKGRGLGWALMQLMIEYATSIGLKILSGQILQDNTVMLKMCRELGFDIKTDVYDRGLCNVTLVLDD